MTGEVSEVNGDVTFFRLRQLHGPGNQGCKLASGDDRIGVYQTIGITADDALIRKGLNGFLRPMAFGILKIPIYRIGAARKQGNHHADHKEDAERFFHFLIHRQSSYIPPMTGWPCSCWGS